MKERREYIAILSKFPKHFICVFKTFAAMRSKLLIFHLKDYPLFSIELDD